MGINVQNSGPVPSPIGNQGGDSTASTNTAGNVKPTNVNAGDRIGSLANDATDSLQPGIGTQDPANPPVPPKPPVIINWGLNFSGLVNVALLKLQLGLVDLKKSTGESQMNEMQAVLDFADQLKQNRKDQAEKDMGMKYMEMASAGVSAISAGVSIGGMVSAGKTQNAEMSAIKAEGVEGAPGSFVPDKGFVFTKDAGKLGDAKYTPLSGSSNKIPEVSRHGLPGPLDPVELAEIKIYNAKIDSIRHIESQAQNRSSATKSKFDLGGQFASGLMDTGMKGGTAELIRQKGEKSGDEVKISAEKELMSRVVDRRSQMIADAQDMIRDLIQLQKELSSANNSIAGGR